MAAVGSSVLAESAAADTAVRPRLRLGLFVDGPEQPRWLVETFARLARLDFIDLVVIASDDSTAASLPWMWRAYSWLDRLVFRPRTGDAERRSIAEEIPHRRFMSVRQCDVSWVGEMAAMKLDVAFAFGRFDDYALKDIARYGSWRFFFGDERQTLDHWAGFQEAAQGAPVVSSGVTVRFGPRSSERLAYQSWSRTYPLSMARNRENLLRKTAEFAGRTLRELHSGGAAWLESRPLASRQAIAPAAPRPVEMALYLSRLGGRLAQRAAQKLTQIEQWCLGYRFDAGERWQGELSRFTRLLPPTDRFWADPFAYRRDGRHFIFLEELPFARGKAHISVMEVDRDGRHSKPRCVLKRDYHLSYPFLIEDKGELYMVPETGENRTVEIYRCVEFPWQWQLEKVLLRDAWCVDATFHRHEGKWWMFVNIGVEGAENYDELHLYHADELLGEWTPHIANPIKSDVRGARPAGRLYRQGGALYRLAQICAPLYGSGIVVHKVLELNTERYREEEVERVLPGKSSGLLGMHTYNRDGELSVMDGFLRRPRLHGRAVDVMRSVMRDMARPVRSRLTGQGRATVAGAGNAVREVQ